MILAGVDAEFWVDRVCGFSEEQIIGVMRGRVDPSRAGTLQRASSSCGSSAERTSSAAVKPRGPFRIEFLMWRASLRTPIHMARSASNAREVGTSRAAVSIRKGKTLTGARSTRRP